MKYRVLKDDEVIQKGDVFTGCVFGTEYTRAKVKNDSFWGITVLNAKDRVSVSSIFERPILKKQKYRKLNDDEIIQKGDTVGGDDEHTLVIDMWYGKKASVFNNREPVKYFVERPIGKRKKLERVTIADVLVIMSDGDGQAPEDLLDDVEDMLRSILERKQSKKPSLEKLIAERDLGMYHIKMYDDFSGRVLVTGAEDPVLRFSELSRLKSWLLGQPLKKE